MVVHCIRGSATESVHGVSAVLVQADGTVLERVGPDCVTTWRSGAKPLQLEVSLDLLPHAFSDRDLAIGASSHAGQDRHIAHVTDLLGRLGLDVHSLYCGAHWPLHQPTTRSLGHEPGTLHNNCSGKHSFMAAASAQMGWDPDYRDPSHPLQKRIRSSIDERTGGGVVDGVIDGCGVPCWVASITAMARGYAHIAAEWESDGALGRIGRAMLAEPLYASGDDRVDGDVMRDATRPVVAKVGAAALICLALPEAKAGLALKVHTADDAVRAVALQAVLDRWFPGLLPTRRVEHVVTNCVGREVGARIARREAVDWP